MTSTPTIKKIIYIFDVICLLLASVLIGFGAYILCTNETNEIASLGAYGYIAIGVATFVVFIFLNVGAIRDHVCCTVTFIVLIILVILGQAAIGAFMTAGRDTVASNLSNTVDAAWEKELKTKDGMRMYEQWLSCCGRGSPQDYIVNVRMPPVTCYVNQDDKLATNLIETGCRIKFEDYWIHLLFIFNILSWCLIGLELITCVIACGLCNSIRNDRRRTFY